MEKHLSQILGAVPAHILNIQSIRHGQDTPDPVVTGLAYDSRSVKRGFLFFALPGLHADGTAFIPQAVENGASVIVHQGDPGTYDGRASYIREENARPALSPVSDVFFGNPSSRLKVVGVTGTEGKSTTVYLIYQLLCLTGRKAGFISTVRYSLGDAETDNPEHQTTPEAPVIHEKLHAMAENGCEFAVVESSSHGLSHRTGRLADVRFDAGVMMNVTHEHLEFHGTHEQYKSDKANLFRALTPGRHVKCIGGTETDVPSFGVVNMEDAAAAYFVQASAHNVYGFATEKWFEDTGERKIPEGITAFLGASAIEGDSSGVSFTVTETDGETAVPWPARIELPGTFNVYNTLAALTVVSRFIGIPARELAPLLPRLRPVRGRMTVVDRGQPFEVIVDYAHTPSSFETVFPPLRLRAKNRIISLFGSGGERDIQKRPAQGKIAAEYSDIVILADEEPRGEDHY